MEDYISQGIYNRNRKSASKQAIARCLSKYVLHLLVFYLRHNRSNSFQYIW